jgi:hypothetical protein
LYFGIEKLMAFPTTNRKVGNTRSVGVNPCHAACDKGAKGVAPLPGVFTMIIKQIVMPLKTSRARKRGETGFVITNGIYTLI